MRTKQCMASCLRTTKEWHAVSFFLNREMESWFICEVDIVAAGHRWPGHLQQLDYTRNLEQEELNTKMMTGKERQETQRDKMRKQRRLDRDNKCWQRVLHLMVFASWLSSTMCNSRATILFLGVYRCPCSPQGKCERSGWVIEWWV